MDRSLPVDLHAMLSPEGAGGLVEAAGTPDVTSLAATANEYGGRFAELAGPTSKAELLDALHEGLALPDDAGRDWDALAEMLRDPGTSGAGPIIIAWSHPERLAGEDAAAFRSTVVDLAEQRAAAGEGSLIVVAGPTASLKDRSPAAVPSAIRDLGKVHHVALIVADIEQALRFWRDTLGAPLESIMDIEHDRVRIAFLTVGESKVELVQPTDDTTGVARFLAGKGEGFHHVCFEVDDLAGTLDRLAADGLELIDPAPRRGAEGPVAFIHPRSCHGVLVELIEAPGGPAWASLGF
jgi:methylmalonyl-CoA/ethylmalonyl-CoA epimerase